RQNRATAKACSESTSKEGCLAGESFGMISNRTPGTAPSVRALMDSKVSTPTIQRKYKLSRMLLNKREALVLRVRESAIAPNEAVLALTEPFHKLVNDLAYSIRRL